MNVRRIDPEIAANYMRLEPVEAARRWPEDVPSESVEHRSMGSILEPP